MALKVQKEQDLIKLSLEKNNLKDIKIDVRFITDVSGSMEPFYGENKPMTYVMQKALAAASVMDPDGMLPLTAFDTQAYDLGTFSIEEFDSIYQTISTKDRRFWGGTRYSAALQEVVRRHKACTLAETVLEKSTGVLNTIKSWFKSDTPKQTTLVETPKEPKTDISPELILFFTDGDDGGNQEELYDILQYIVDNTDIFVMFIGLGERAARKLNQIDDDFDGIGTIIIDNINQITTDDFADLLITREFAEWYEKHSN